MAECRTDCGHDAYDADCSDYVALPCCGYVVAAEDGSDPGSHMDTCHEALAYDDDFDGVELVTVSGGAKFLRFS